MCGSALQCFQNEDKRVRMPKTDTIFKYQGWHLLAVVISMGTCCWFAAYDPHIAEGELLGIGSKAWFVVAFLVPVLHQIYVAVVWRLELYRDFFTRRYGLKKAFGRYKTGFSLLFGSRLLFIIPLAVSNADTLEMPAWYGYLGAAVLTPVAGYLFYSVKTYFTIDRAYGIDHFDKHYREPFVKQGIFRFSDNAMYVFGLSILYIPGLLTLSYAALVVAAFNHLYIWVHYLTVERPDMECIYGKTPSAG